MPPSPCASRTTQHRAYQLDSEGVTMKTSSKLDCLGVVRAVAGAIAGGLLFAGAGPAVATPGWDYVATEGVGHTFTVPGTGALVRYGDYDVPNCTNCTGKWIYAGFVGSMAGTYACSNATFGDPYLNRVKRCEVFNFFEGLSEPW